MDVPDSLLLGSAAIDGGFALAIKGTRFGLGIARSITTGLATAGGIALDAVLAPPQQELNDSGRASTLFSSAVSTGWDAIDFLSLTPLHLSRSLVASSLASLSDLHSFLFPPSSEEAFSLRSFVALVQREAVDEKQRERLPDGVRYSVAGVGKALVAWTALTAVTREWGEGKMLEGLREVDVEREWGSCSGMNQPLQEEERRGDDPIGRSEKGGQADEEKVVVTGVDHEELGRQEVGETGQLESLTIVNASVGVDARLSSTIPSALSGPDLPLFSSTSVDASSSSPTHSFHSDLLRFSRIALGSYGGAGLLFFNVPIPRAMQPPVSQATQDASAVEEVLEVVEQVELAESETPQGAVGQKGQGKRTARDGEKQEAPQKKGKVGLWDTIRGQHDQTIFEHFAGMQPSNIPSSAPSASTAPEASLSSDPALTADDSASTTQSSATLIPISNSATLHPASSLPRFWILTDHTRREIVLSLRGTMSLTDLAIDLTCDSASFTPHLSPVPPSPSSSSASSPASTSTPPPLPTSSKSYQVHSGMLLLARRLAHPTSPLYIALTKALSEHEGYGLVICGHSLGAGVGALLGMLWADLSTAETVGEGLALDVGRETSHGRGEIGKLPKGRKVKVYAFASPCITSSALSTLARPLITSVVLSYDLVSRLSLGSIRDLRAVSDWISYGLSDGESGSVDGLIGKLSARKVRSLTGSEGDKNEMDWLVGLRKTLEAQIIEHHLYPAGTTYLLLRPGDLHPSHHRPSPLATEAKATRFFEVRDPEKVFTSIVFDPSMLSCHLPHNYAAAIAELV